MNSYDWLALALTGFSVLMIPALAVLVRGAVKWTRTEDRLAELVADVRELIADKDRMQEQVLEQMRTDREATDRRLRYLEEFWMDRGRAAIRHVRGG